MDKFLFELDDLCKKHNIEFKYIEGLEEKIDFVKEFQQSSTSTSTSFSTYPCIAATLNSNANFRVS